MGRHGCNRHYQQQRRIYCLYDPDLVEDASLTNDTKYESENHNKADNQDDALIERLTDPLFLLLIRHSIFCREIEKYLKHSPQTYRPRHRTMRHPARQPNHSSFEF